MLGVYFGMCIILLKLIGGIEKGIKKSGLTTFWSENCNIVCNNTLGLKWLNCEKERPVAAQSLVPILCNNNGHLSGFHSAAEKKRIC